METQYTICRWTINRSDPQNLLSVTLDVPLHLLPAMLCKILFFWETRLFYQNCIFQRQQIFNQFLPLLRGELTDVHLVGTILDYMVCVSASVAPSRRQGSCFPSGVHVHGDFHRWSGWQSLWSDQRGQSKG